MYVTVETIQNTQYLIARLIEREGDVFFPELKWAELLGEGVNYNSEIQGYILGNSNRDYINDEWEDFKPWQFETPWIERMFRTFVKLEGELIV